jgi:surface antigen
LNIPYTLRAKTFLTLGTKVNHPQPGDIAVFTRQGGGHVGIVEKVNRFTITIIEGNVGDYPAKVKRITYKEKPKQLLAYIRLGMAK